MAVGLIYRFPKGKNGYVFKNSAGKTIKDKKLLKFAQSFYIAPAYKNVEIHPDPKDKILYTAIDVGGKKQYFYKEFWHNKQDRKKFCHMIEFGKAMPKIKKQISKDLAAKRWTQDRIVALQLKIMILCNFRVGNLINGNKTKSTGISTLKRKHLFYSNNGNKPVEIKFIGKSGIENQCTVKDKQVIKLIKELAKSRKKGDYLFVNGNGTRIDSVAINKYLKQFGEFTSKDFRTWVANTQFIKGALSNKNAPSEAITARKKEAREAVKGAAEQLHHTVAICKKRYIYPKLFELYVEEPKKFMKILEKVYRKNGEEKAFVQFMESNCSSS